MEACRGCDLGEVDVADQLLVERYGCLVGEELGVCGGLDGLSPELVAEQRRRLARAWGRALEVGVWGVWQPIGPGEPAPPQDPEPCMSAEVMMRRGELLDLARVCLTVAERVSGRARMRQLTDAHAYVSRASDLRRSTEVDLEERRGAGRFLGNVEHVMGDLASADGLADSLYWCTANVEGEVLSWLRVPTVTPGWMVLGPIRL
jgi:hypothetical protein